MKLKTLRVIAIFLLISACSGHDSGKKTADKRALSEKISSLLKDERLTGAISSITVRNAQTGEMLYQYQGSTRLIPASGMKLITASAAFALLGGDYQFTTRLQSDGPLKEGRLQGNLYLRGTGDPGLTLSHLQAMVKGLVDQGIKTIQGDLIADDSEFDQIRLGQDWAQDDEPMAYAAQISALTLSPDDSYHAGSVLVNVTGSNNMNAAGQVSMVPENDYVNIINQSATGPHDSISVTREHGTNNVVISGSVPPFQTTTALVSVWEPTQLVSRVFIKILKENGIHIKGIVRTGKKTPAHAVLLAQHQSIRLSELTVPFMKLSNNTIAEIWLKAMGKKDHAIGTTQSGINRVMGLLHHQGLDTSSLTMVDGSGLSRRNLLTTIFMTDLLMHVQKEAWFASWYSSLPVACLPEKLQGGTLRHRMCQTAAGRVVAKTGSLSGISSISGYVTTLNDTRLVFSIIVNNQRSPVKEIEDMMVTLLAQSHV